MDISTPTGTDIPNLTPPAEALVDSGAPFPQNTYRLQCVDVELRNSQKTNRAMLKLSWEGIAPESIRCKLPDGSVGIYKFAGEVLDVYLFGMIDLLAEGLGDRLIIDHKYTSAYAPVEYFKSFKASSQFRMYKLAVEKLAELYPETFGELRGVKAMVDGIFLRKTGAEYHRSEVMELSDGDIQEFEKLLHRKLLQLDHFISGNLSIREGILNGACQGEYFKLCPFFDACHSSTPEVMNLRLESDFTRRIYSPEIFNDEDQL